jgi:hypothetical protein
VKCISVPVNHEAMQRLDVDRCIEGDSIEISLTSSEFDFLWKSGIFREINDRLGIFIDDYEDEELVGIDRLLILKKIIEGYLLRDKSSIILNKFISQVERAIVFNTGIFFYF